MKNRQGIDKTTAIFLALFCMFLWGSAFPAIKLSYGVLGIGKDEKFLKILFAGCRFFLSGLLVGGVYLLRHGKFPDYRRGGGKKLWILGIFQTAVQYTCFYIGLGNTTGAKSSVIQASSTFMTVLFAAMVFPEEKMTRNKISAVLLGTLGIVVVNLHGITDLSFQWQGEGLLLLSAAIAAISTVYVKKEFSRFDTFIVSSGQMLIGSTIMILIGIAGREHSVSLTPMAVGLFLYLCFISSTAMTLWYFLLKSQPAGEISVYRLFIPVFGVVLSTIFLGEPLHPGLLPGLGLVILGILLLNGIRIRAGKSMG